MLGLWELRALSCTDLIFVGRFVSPAIEFSPAEALFSGQTDDITAFLRKNAVSVDILCWGIPVGRKNDKKVSFRKLW